MGLLYVMISIKKQTHNTEATHLPKENKYKNILVDIFTSSTLECKPSRITKLLVLKQYLLLWLQLL